MVLAYFKTLSFIILKKIVIIFNVMITSETLFLCFNTLSCYSRMLSKKFPAFYGT